MAYSHTVLQTFCDMLHQMVNSRAREAYGFCGLQGSSHREGLACDGAGPMGLFHAFPIDFHLLKTIFTFPSILFAPHPMLRLYLCLNKTKKILDTTISTDLRNNTKEAVLPDSSEHGGFIYEL